MGLSHPGYHDEWQLGPDLSFGMGLGHRDEWHSDLSLGVGLSHPDYRDEWQLSPTSLLGWAWVTRAIVMWQSDLSLGVGLSRPGYHDEWQLSPNLSLGVGLSHPGYRDLHLHHPPHLWPTSRYFPRPHPHPLRFQSQEYLVSGLRRPPPGGTDISAHI